MTPSALSFAATALCRWPPFGTAVSYGAEPASGSDADLYSQVGTVAGAYAAQQETRTKLYKAQADLADVLGVANPDVDADGESAAQEAAEILGCGVAIPVGMVGTDWCDLRQEWLQSRLVAGRRESDIRRAVDGEISAALMRGSAWPKRLTHQELTPSR